MITNELIKNTALDLKEVLTDFSSENEQRDYKDKVPYVHIPDELIEQIYDHVRMLQECAWYAKIYNPKEIELIRAFYSKVEMVISKYGQEIPDVPEIFQVSEWQCVMKESAKLLEAIGKKIDVIITGTST